ALEYLRKDIYQIAQKAFIDVLRYGRAGVLVDYPSLDETPSLQQQQQQQIGAELIYYSPFNIVNWSYQRGKLQFVLLAEQVTTIENFQHRTVKQYRHLGLDEQGYFVEVWDEHGNVRSRTYPKAQGQAWREIPFVVIGADSNDLNEQSIPLESLAKINLAHYRNSADYEDSVFKCGQVQPFMNGVSESRLRYYEQAGLRLGSSTCLMLEDGGSFGFAQAQPNTLVAEALKQKYELMLHLGAKLVEPTSGNKTATQAEYENSTQNSIASMCIANLNEAFNVALSYAWQYAGSGAWDKQAMFKVKQDLVQPYADAGLMTTLMAYVQAGLAPKTVVYHYLRKHNLLDSELSDDDIEGMIEQLD
ncbi:MAG: DUF4055 domain-containing protein, partial [Acinetobacter sp.]|nr:DUF4055 domain-containing protein [Acinetobacter sp.]